MAQRKQQCKVGENKSELVRDVPLACADEGAAVEFLERLRWDGDPCCPECESRNVYQMKNRQTGEREKHYRWRCRDCGRLYSVRLGTVLEESRIPLRHWCYAFWAACAGKKGVSAKQIQRMTGVSYKSALFMMHRVRWAMAPINAPKLEGVVQVDETYIGGRPRYVIPHAHKAKHGPRKRNKRVVFAALCQDTGQVRARVLPNVTGESLRNAVNDLVERSSKLVTDEARAYPRIAADFAGHETVQHRLDQYVREGITTNTVEGFFSLFKRQIFGTHHNVSKKHLQRYVDEAEFKYNTRKVDDGERMRRAVQGAVGKRLVYKSKGE